MLSDLLSPHKASFKDYTELRAQVNTTRAVTFLAGNMVANSQNSIGGVSARVYRGGTYGFASGAEYSDESIKNVLSAATGNAVFMDSHVKKGLGPLPAVAAGKVGLKKEPSNDAPQSVLIEFAKALDALVAGRYKNLSSRSVRVNCLDIEKILAVSDGTDSHFFQPRSFVYVTMTAETDDKIPVELYIPIGGFGSFGELFSDPALLTETLDKLHEQLMQKREGVYSNAGLRKCVLGPELSGMLAHEAIGHTVEADIVQGGSIAGSYMNKVVASELVSMVDFAHTAFGKTCPLPVYVDDEGTFAEDVTLIDKGVLKSYMHSKESAKHFGVKPQGNARGFLFSDEPLIRMRNTAVLPGSSKLEDMIASVDDGYYLVKSGNGQADTTSEFMFSVNLGYEIKKGKIGKALRETTISGVAFEMLKTVDMISDDMFWACSGFCGKKQPMTVSMGGPAIRCDLNIGGR
jgi:TldD protein